MTNEPKTVAIDLDGVLYQLYWTNDDVLTAYQPFVFGSLVPGAVDAVQGLKNDGWKIIIHTARLWAGNPVNMGFSQQQMIDAVQNRLDQDTIPYDVLWTEGGKPSADYYVDDKAITFSTWHETLRQMDAS